MRLIATFIASIIIFGSCTNVPTGEAPASSCYLSQSELNSLITKFEGETKIPFVDSEFSSGARRTIVVGSRTARLAAGSPTGFYGDLMPYWEIKFEKPCKFEPVLARKAVNFEANETEVNTILLVSKVWENPEVSYYFDLDDNIFSIFDYPNPYENENN